MKKIPVLLIYSRLLIGIVIFICSLLHINHYSVIAVVLFSLGLLTDIFDGIIARRINVYTEKLRRLDSTIDQVFFLLVAAATYLDARSFFYNNRVALFILLGIEALAYVICFLNFRKEIATHTISSKIWTLLLFATIIQLMYFKNAFILFQVCFYIGIITRLEIIAIIFVLRNWTNDVPSIYQAVLLRQGKPIKRHKLFNG